MSSNIHQRHVVTGSDAVPCCNNHNGHGHGHGKKGNNDTEMVDPSVTGKSFRKRRKPSSSVSSSRPKRLPARGSSMPTVVELLHVNVNGVASLLQILSVLIVVVCAAILIGLLIFKLISGDDSDDPTSSSGAGVGVGAMLGLYGSIRKARSSSSSNKAGVGVGLMAKYPRTHLKPSKLYTIPGSMPHIGDKSDQYAALRKEFDEKQQRQELPHVEPQMHLAPVTTDVPYDIYNCPEEPPTGYPFAWNLLKVVQAWPPDDPKPRPQIFQGLCVFDYTKTEDLEKAYNYRAAEVPFVINGDPAVQQAVQRWNAPNYLERMLGRVQHRAEYSDSNHFMYWNPPPKIPGRVRNNPNPKLQQKQDRILKANPSVKDWKQPTQMIRMAYSAWLEHANVTDESMLGPDQPHWYFRLIGCGETGPEGQCDNGSSEYLFDELTFFQPKESIYMVDPSEQKGIHCRFGMKGVIAENHFDGSRNMIVVLGGERRYILSHPDQCEFLSLLPKGHPSARHSAVDWSDPDLDTYPEFALAQANEVVLQAGDVLYLPTNWFHYIISLSLNFQCNTRSGIGQDYMAPIHHCGF